MTTENAEMLIKKVKGKSTDQVRAIVDALKSVTKQAEPLPLFATVSTTPEQQPALEDNTAKIVAQSLAAVTSPTKKPLPTSEQIEALNPATVAEPAKVIRFTGENLFLYRKAEERFGHLRDHQPRFHCSPQKPPTPLYPTAVLQYSNPLHPRPYPRRGP
jgi:hypothetical protein